MPHRIAPKIIIAVLAVGLLALALIVLTPSPAPAKPSISWTPRSVTHTILAGESATVPVSFAATENLTNVVVRVVPELAPYVQTNPASFARITKGQTVNLDVTISAPATMLPGMFDGTIQLRSGSDPKKTYARPLAVVIEVVWHSFSDDKLGLAIEYPPTWIIRPADRTTVFSNVLEPSEPSETALQAESFFEIRLHASKNPDLLPIDQWLNQFFSQGFAVEPLSQTSFSVDGHDAVRVETSEIGRRVHIYISNQTNVIEITYGLYAPQFIDEYQVILNSLRFTQ